MPKSPGCFVAEFQFEDPSTSKQLAYSVSTEMGSEVYTNFQGGEDTEYYYYCIDEG